MMNLKRCVTNLSLYYNPLSTVITIYTLFVNITDLEFACRGYLFVMILITKSDNFLTHH
jgi:hypothetical protein